VFLRATGLVYKRLIVNAKDLHLSRAVGVAAGIMMAMGLSLVFVAWWLRPITGAERAMANGNLERAVEQYAVGRRRVSLIPFAQDLVPGLHDLLAGNELSLQYALRRYDRILEGRNADTDRASASFWAGCVLFDKALVERVPKARLEMMSEAHRTFRRALELNPGDWDTKFNYEVVDRLLRILQEQPEASPQEIFKILRDRGLQPRTGRRTG
jgi:hypothetical protein